MGFRYSVVVHPLIAPIAGTLVGGVIGFLTTRGVRSANVSRLNVVPAAIGIAALAALTPYNGQLLYDWGFAMRTIDAIQSLSYPVLAFTTAAVWPTVDTFWQRRTFQALLLVAFGPPFLWALVYIGWEVGGFAP